MSGWKPENRGAENGTVTIYRPGATLETFQYDALGRNVQVNNGSGFDTIAYDTAGRQVQSSFGSTYIQNVWGLVYVNDLILRDRNQDGSTSTGGLGFSGSGLEEREYAQHDRQFSVISLTDSSGSVIQRIAYDPYGKATLLTATWAYDSTQGGTNYWLVMFQGMTLIGDGPTGGNLEQSDTRVYDVDLGRWGSQDRGYWDGANRYQFLAGDPLDAVDPSGLKRRDTKDIDDDISDLLRNHPEMGHGVADPTYPLPGTPSNGDISSPDDLFHEWLNGTAPANRYFAPGTPFNNMMRSGIGAQKLAKDIASKLSAYCSAGAKGPLPSSAFSGATYSDFKHDISHLLFRAGYGRWLFNENTAQIFVGSFDATFTVLNIDCCKKQATVAIWAKNVSGTASLTHWPGTPAFIPNIPNGHAMGVTSQTWNYTETISWGNGDVSRSPAD